MSVYTPRIGGTLDGNKKAIDYVATDVGMDIPAILRLKPAEPQLRDGAMRIKLETAPRVSPVVDSVTEAECRAYQRMLGSAVAGDATARADPELLAQIPRLKETLLALDSEMKANATSDLDKRLAVHARILELQGEQLTEMKKKIQKTEISMGTLMKHQNMHTQLHEATTVKVLQADKTASDVQAKMARVEKQADMHEAMHVATAEKVLSVASAMERTDKQTKLYKDLHKETGEIVLKLQKDSDMYKKLHEATIEHVTQAKKDACMKHAKTKESLRELHKDVKGMQNDNSFYKDFHEETALNVLDLKKKYGGMQRHVDELRTDVQEGRKKGDLHSQIHLQVGADFKKMQTCLNNMQVQSNQVSPPDQSIASHQGPGKRVAKKAPTGVQAAVMSTQSFASAGGSTATQDAAVDVHRMRSDLDAVLMRNAELEKKMKMHDQMHLSTTNVVRGLGQKIEDKEKSSLELDTERRMLALFETDVASSNTRGQNRKK